jgi:hypothetical protein
VEEDPAGAALLLELLNALCKDCLGSQSDDNHDDEPPLELWGDTHKEKILQLFADQNNPWLSVSDIRVATDIGRGAVAQVLYSTHAELFERKPHPTHAKMSMWRVHPDKLKIIVSEARRNTMEGEPEKRVHEHHYHASINNQDSSKTSVRKESKAHEEIKSVAMHEMAV